MIIQVLNFFISLSNEFLKTFRFIVPFEKFLAFKPFDRKFWNLL